MQNILIMASFSLTLAFGLPKATQGQTYRVWQAPTKNGIGLGAGIVRLENSASLFHNGALPLRIDEVLASRLAVKNVGHTAIPSGQYLQLQSSNAPLGSAERGKELFSGSAAFQRGGPPCVSCHSVAGLPFPSGGSLGPNLTHTYTKLGSEGIDAALQTLFFPAMTPLYEAHQLTPQERNDLKAFFQQEDSQQVQEGRITVIFILIALGGLVIFLILAGLIWRGRLRRVRKHLVESASR